MHLSDIQAEAILELRLRHLAKLQEEIKLQAESDETGKERDSIEKQSKFSSPSQYVIEKER